jgi:membrane protease YdiL (CAAX protease family)
MIPFDETPQPPQEPAPDRDNRSTQTELPRPPLPAIGEIAALPEAQPVPTAHAYPEDLQITWSWPHFTLLLFFGFASLIFIQSVLAIHYTPPKAKGLTTSQLQEYLLSKPQFAIGSMLLWYAAIFFFLYVTLSVLRGHSFWQSLGWRPIKSRSGELPSNPFLYFASGCGLSLFVAILSARMKTPENLPMEELFKYRQVALMFMAMAVLVAPLVEETLFRGYLYPLFARSFGVWPGIVLTGVLFGLMHGAQLGWTWSLVTILIMVGIVFTLIRARTGSVFASYLMHLGYNSLISLFAILGTHGFTKLPVDH